MKYHDFDFTSFGSIYNSIVYWKCSLCWPHFRTTANHVLHYRTWVLSINDLINVIPICAPQTSGYIAVLDDITATWLVILIELIVRKNLICRSRLFLTAVFWYHLEIFNSTNVIAKICIDTIALFILVYCILNLEFIHIKRTRCQQ